jgi:hypothetical protein
MHVLHQCDNPPCVNPDHLFLGTNAENMADRDAKGRQRPGRLAGLDHPRVKLSYDKADEIRALVASGRFTKAEIGRQYGVNRRSIWLIAAGRKWARNESQGASA